MVTYSKRQIQRIFPTILEATQPRSRPGTNIDLLLHPFDLWFESSGSPERIIPLIIMSASYDKGMMLHLELHWY